MKKKGLVLSILSICAMTSFSGYSSDYHLSNLSPKRAINAQYNQFISDCNLYGFSVDSNWVPIYASKQDSFHTYRYEYVEWGEINHTTTLEEVMLRNINSKDNYAFIYRIGVSPVQCRDWGFLGINSHGDNWYFHSLETVCTLWNEHTLSNFAPTNATIKGSTSLGINLGMDSSKLTGGISCSISYNFDELSIISKSSLATNTFHVIYQDPYYSNYTANAAFYYGMFTFKCPSAAFVSITHTITYDGTEWYHLNSEPSKVTFTNLY